MNARERARQADKLAQEIRKEYGFDPDQPINPFDLAEAMCVRVQFLDQIHGLDSSLVQKLRSIQNDWWGFALPSQSLVVLNHMQSEQRTHSTLAEELVHIYCDHSPSIVYADSPSGLSSRTHSSEIEAEAFWTGAALLLPGFSLTKDLWLQMPIDVLAKKYDVSTELVSFRIKTLGLWKATKNDTAA